MKINILCSVTHYTQYSSIIFIFTWVIILTTLPTSGHHWCYLEFIWALFCVTLKPLIQTVPPDSWLWLAPCLMFTSARQYFTACFRAFCGKRGKCIFINSLKPKLVIINGQMFHLAFCDSNSILKTESMCLCTCPTLQPMSKFFSVWDWAVGFNQILIHVLKIHFVFLRAVIPVLSALWA